MLVFLFVDLRYSDIEKEKQDGQSPRGVLEVCMESFESDTSVSENSKPESEAPCPDSKPQSHWRKFFKLWSKRSIKQRLPSFPLGVPKMSKRSNSTKDNSVLTNIYNFKSQLMNFSFSALQTATNNFNNGTLTTFRYIHVLYTVWTHLLKFHSRIYPIVTHPLHIYSIGILLR